jgi:RNA polymerase sigma-70 factor (ECF subfamily)
VSDDQLDRIVMDHHQAGLSRPDAALLDFALKLATRGPWLSAKDIAVLRDHGFSDECILEAILVISLTDFFSTLSIGLGSSPEFEPAAIPGAHKTLPPDVGCFVGGTGGPYLPTVEMSPTSFPPFAFVLERYGLIPRLFEAQTLRPDLIEAETDAIRKVLGPVDLLSRVQKEYIFLVGSAANLNTYCVAAHCEMLRTIGVPAEESDQIAVDHHQAELSDANKKLLDFALKLTARSPEFGREDIDSLRRHRFSDEHILEAVVVTALNNFFNTLQMGLGTTPDFETRHVFGPKETHLSLATGRPTKEAQVDVDSELVARAQHGDLVAFEELVARHGRRVYRTLMSIVGNIEEAQDAMQDTFLKAFQHIGEFQGRSKFSTWLLSIAANTAVQRVRGRKHFESIDEASSEEDPAFRPQNIRAWTEDPEQLYSRAERRGLVESAMMQLPPKYRAVLVLRDIEQLSGAEAAAALGLGIPAMKARLLRARLMLREVLAPHFVRRTK